MGISLTSIKIPRQFYEKLKQLKYSLYLEHCVEVSFVDIMKIILDETNWEALGKKIIEMKQAGYVFKEDSERDKGI